MAKGGFSKWMLSEYGQEKYDQYSDDLFSSPLELCLYCKSSLSFLSMDALRLSDGATATLAKASSDTALAKASSNTALAKASGDTTFAEASGDDHSGITNNSVSRVDMVGINGVALSSEQHYKNSNYSLRILAVMCRGIKTDDGGEIVDFDVEPWKSLKGNTCRPRLLEWRSEVQ